MGLDRQSVEGKTFQTGGTTRQREGSRNEPGRGVCEDTGLPAGVGRGMPWSVVKTKTEFGQGWSSTRMGGMGPAGNPNYCSS